MIFLQFVALFVIYAGSLTVMVLLPVAVVAVLGTVCVRAIMMRVHGRNYSARAASGR